MQDLYIAFKFTNIPCPLFYLLFTTTLSKITPILQVRKLRFRFGAPHQMTEPVSTLIFYAKYFFHYFRHIRHSKQSDQKDKRTHKIYFLFICFNCTFLYKIKVLLTFSQRYPFPSRSKEHNLMSTNSECWGGK